MSESLTMEEVAKRHIVSKDAKESGKKNTNHASQIAERQPGNQRVYATNMRSNPGFPDFSEEEELDLRLIKEQERARQKEFAQRYRGQDEPRLEREREFQHPREMRPGNEVRAGLRPTVRPEEPSPGFFEMLRMKAEYRRGVSTGRIMWEDLAPNLLMLLVWSAAYFIGIWSFIMSAVQLGWVKLVPGRDNPLDYMTSAPFAFFGMAVIYAFITRYQIKYFLDFRLKIFIPWLIFSGVDQGGIFTGAEAVTRNFKGQWSVFKFELGHSNPIQFVVAFVLSCIIAFATEPMWLHFFKEVRYNLGWDKTARTKR